MDIHTVLKEVVQIKGVNAVAVVSLEGFVVESLANDGFNIDLNFIGGVVSSTVATGQSLVEVLGRGKLNHMMLEFEEGPMLMSTVESYVLLSALDSAQDLGRVRFQLRKHLNQLATVLSA